MTPPGRQANRHACRIDENQPDIIKGLRKAGATVEPTYMVGAGFPDLVVGYMGMTLLMEVKLPVKSSQLNPKQVKWHEAWDGQVCVVRTPEQAVSALELELQRSINGTRRI